MSTPRITPNTLYDQNGRPPVAISLDEPFTPSGIQVDWNELLKLRSCTVTDGKYQTLTVPTTLPSPDALSVDSVEVDLSDVDLS